MERCCQDACRGGLRLRRSVLDSVSSLYERGCRPSFRGRVLPGRSSGGSKSQGSRTHTPVDGMQSVTDPRLARFELQPDAAQPFLGNLPRSLDSGTCGMQHHEVIRIDHHMWTVVMAEGGGDSSLQTMQSDEREQR